MLGIDKRQMLCLGCKEEEVIIDRDSICFFFKAKKVIGDGDVYGIERFFIPL